MSATLTVRLRAVNTAPVAPDAYTAPGGCGVYAAHRRCDPPLVIDRPVCYQLAVPRKGPRRTGNHMDLHAPTSDVLAPRESLSVLLARVLTPTGFGRLPSGLRRWLAECQTDWERAVAECSDYRWLIRLAGELRRRGYLRRVVLVRYACACARSVLHLAPAGEERPRLAVEAVERWTRNEATFDDVLNAQADAWGARHVHSSCVAAAAATAPGVADAALGHGAVLTAVLATASYATAAAAVAYAAGGATRVTAHKIAEAEILSLTRRDLGPVLLASFAAHTATIPGASR